MLLKYIESRVFLPPQPLLDYPLDLAEDIDAEETLVNDVCTDIFQECGVPSICSLFGDGVLARFNVVFFHGNSEDLKSIQWFIKDLREVLLSNVYAFEYAGYFRASGAESPVDAQPSEQGCFENAEKFIEALQKRSRLPVILFGYSLGSAIALHCAEKFKSDDFPKAVILLAPFVSAASVVLAPYSSMLSFTSLWRPFDVFSMRSSALNQGHRIFIAAGGKDDVVPECHSKAIARWAGRNGRVSYLLIPEADHSSIRLYADLYEHINHFLHEL